MPRKKIVNKGGRPSAYKPIYNKQARELCLLGYTDKELAKFFGVSESTLNLWKLEKEGFSESLKSGKELADCHVVHSLYTRATGQTITETTIMPDETKIKKIKEIPADTTAQIFWLKNRQPKLWRDKIKDEEDKENLLDGLSAIAKALKGEND